MATVDDIKNSALMQIGAQPEVDFVTTPLSKKALVCNQFYPSFKEKLISMNRWVFARKRVKLDTFVPSVDQLYANEFDLPADYLHLIALYRDDQYIGVIRRYELIGNKIYTEDDELFMYYIINADESLFPEYFTDLFKIAFASEIAFFVTGDKKLEASLQQEAYGPLTDNKRGGRFGASARVDATQNMPKIIDDSPILTSRFAGVKNRF